MSERYREGVSDASSARLSVSKKRVLCMFCNEWGPRAEEDPFALWIARDLGGVKPFYNDNGTLLPSGDWQQDPQYMSGSIASRKVPDVCVGCNSGWMSVLQTHAKQLLRSMILNATPATFWPDTQVLLAKWGTMTALTYDATYVDRWFPPELPHRFFADRQPFPGSEILFGWAEPPPVGSAIWHGRRHWNLASLEGTSVGKSVAVSLVFKFLFFKAVIHHSQTQPVGVGAASNGYFVKTWPPTTRIDWPPSEQIKSADVPMAI